MTSLNVLPIDYTLMKSIESLYVPMHV